MLLHPDCGEISLAEGREGNLWYFGARRTPRQYSENAASLPRTLCGTWRAEIANSGTCRARQVTLIREGASRVKPLVSSSQSYRISQK